MAKSSNGDGPKPKINFSGEVPPAEFNGLFDILDKLTSQPHIRYRAVIEFDASNVNRVTDTRQMVPTIRIHHVEPVVDDEEFEQICRAFLDEKVKARPGQSEMSFEQSPHP